MIQIKIKNYRNKTIKIFYNMINMNIKINNLKINKIRIF